MIPPGTVLVVAAAGSAAIGGARKLIERRKARKQLAARPALGTQTPEGTLVRVTGVVRACDRTLIAPLSGETCVVARTRMWVGNTYFRRAVKPRESFAMVTFELVRDGEPPVSVEGDLALLDLSTHKLRRPRGKASPERARREQLLLEHAIPHAQLRRARFDETIVREGDRVSVVGLMMFDDALVAPPTSELGFRDTARAAVRIAGNVDHPLVIGQPLA
jgi:hypothetical protein